MIEVSVILPNYNHSKFLAQRIESILTQSFQNFELIILDDCSTDNSREVIDSYASNSKISHIIYNKINTGSPFLQWEKGVNLAKGEFIWFAESDDYCEATFLEELVKGIKQDAECVISYCQSYCINDKNEIKWQSSHTSLSEMVDSKRFITEYAVKVSIFNASMAIWRKDKFLQISKEFTTFKFCGDWFFWIQLSRLGKVHISGKLLNYFRKHDNDVSSFAFRTGLNFVEEFKIINGMYQQKLINKKIHYRTYKKKFIEFWKVRKRIEPINLKQINKLLYHPVTYQTSLLKLIPIGIFKALKNKP